MQGQYPLRPTRDATQMPLSLSERQFLIGDAEIMTYASPHRDRLPWPVVFILLRRQLILQFANL